MSGTVGGWGHNAEQMNRESPSRDFGVVMPARYERIEHEYPQRVLRFPLDTEYIGQLRRKSVNRVFLHGNEFDIPRTRTELVSHLEVCGFHQ